MDQTLLVSRHTILLIHLRRNYFITSIHCVGQRLTYSILITHVNFFFNTVVQKNYRKGQVCL